MLIFLSTVLCFAAAVIFYLGCPNQQWLQKPLIKFTPACSLAVLLCLLSILLLSTRFSPLSATFTVITLQMLLMGILPLATWLDVPLTSSRKVKSSLTRDDDYLSHRSQWLLKTLGAIVLSFPLALLFMGTVGFVIGESTPLDVRSQFVMWLIVPLWLLPVSLIYLSKRPLRLFLALLLFNIAAYCALNLISPGA